MSVFTSKEPPERDVNVINGKPTPMIADNNYEIHSTASSDISDSLLEQILGKAYRRPIFKSKTEKAKSQNSLYFTPVSSSEAQRKNNSSFAVVTNSGNIQDNKSLEKVPNREESNISTAVSKKSGGGSRGVEERIAETISNKSGSNKSGEISRIEKESNHITEAISYHSNSNKSGEGSSTEKVISPVAEVISNHSNSNKSGTGKEKSNIIDRISSNSNSNKLGEVSSVEKENSHSIESISNNSSTPSMRKSEGNRYNTVQTQTVAIQTMATGTDIGTSCKCEWRGECPCQKCSPPTCIHDSNHKKIDETSNHSTYGNTETSTETLDTSQHRCNCHCPRATWDDYETQSSTTDQLSDTSDDSYTTDFFDLPYQNNEEYLKLLRELENKLIARNRDRVRKTMLEFEKRSRQNQNLDKPVCDYGGDDNLTILRKFKSIRPGTVCCKCGRNKRKNSDILQNEKRWDEMNFLQSVFQNGNSKMKQPKQCPRIERSLHKSHWQLDPRSGEWVKVSCYQEMDYARCSKHGDYVDDGCKKIMPPPNGCKKECCCCKRMR